MDGLNHPPDRDGNGVDRRGFLVHAGLGGLALAVAPSALARNATPRFAAANDVTKVSYGMTSIGAPYWPIFVANDVGFFAKRRVSVKPVLNPGSTINVQYMVAGDLQMAGVFFDAAATAIDNGARIVGLASFPEIPFSMVVAPNIKSWADLKGKTLGTTLTPSFQAMFERMMQMNGLERDEYRIVGNGNVNNRIVSIKAGAIAGGLMSSPQDFEFVNTGGGRILGFSSDFFHPSQLATFCNWDLVQKNPQTARGYLEGLLLAQDWLAKDSNRARAISILRKYSGATPQACADTWDLYARLKLFKRNWVELDAKGANLQLAFAREGGQAVDLPAQRYFNFSYLNAARKRLEPRKGKTGKKRKK